MAVRLPVLPSRYGSVPAEVWVGDVLGLVGPLAAGAGMRRVLVVTDPGVRQTGWPDRVAGALEAAGLAVAVFDDVWPNPSEDDADRCAASVAWFAADGLVAVGGGSALDTAKAAAMLAVAGGRMADHVGFTDAGALPLLAVPTTAGTGSEVQSFALVSRAGDRRKLACGAKAAMPRAAILDARLTVSVPRSVTGIAAVDAVVHAVEAAVSTASTPASRSLAATAFGRLWRNLPPVLDRPDDVAARGELLVGACMAGQAIEAGMLGAAHAAANPLTARFGVPHGIAVGAMLPAVVRYVGAAAADGYAALAAAGGIDGDLADALEAGIARALVDGIDAFDVDAAAIPDLAVDAATQWTGTFSPRPVDAAAFVDLYRAVLVR